MGRNDILNEKIEYLWKELYYIKLEMDECDSRYAKVKTEHNHTVGISLKGNRQNIIVESGPYLFDFDRTIESAMSECFYRMSAKPREDVEEAVFEIFYAILDNQYDIIQQLKYR